MKLKYEYKFITKETKPIYKEEDENQKIITGFGEDKWYENGQPINPLIEIFNLSNELGLQGWELIAVVPSSTVASVVTSGYTSQELWVFKKPIS